MFAFEVEERRRQALESKNKQSADTLSDFLDFKRWKRWNNSSTTKTTTTTTTLSSSSSLSSRAKDVSVDSEAKSSDRAASETAALAQTEQHHVSVHQTTAPEALRLVLPLTCTAQNLDRSAVYNLLGDVWLMGENGKFEEALTKVNEVQSAPITTWGDLLRLAMMYHQVTLHFMALEARSMARKGLDALDALQGHPLGEVVDMVIEVARSSLLYSSKHSEEERSPYLNRLRELVAEHGHRNVFPRLVFGIRNWRRLGDMAQFVEIVLATQGSEKTGQSGDSSYCPSPLFSWVLMRILFHNVKIAKKKGQLTRKERRDTQELLQKLIDRVIAADINGKGARAAATKLSNELLVVGLLKQ